MTYLLLTGSTGLLGRYLLRDLTLAEVPLAVVVRPSRWESARQRVETAMAHWENERGRSLARPVVLVGDIAQAGLGLSERDVAWVAANCHSVCHSAASLTFHSDDANGEPWRSNVHGTRHVLELCRRANIRSCHHVSTAYVCGRRRGQILESELDVGQEPANDYEQSKLTSEGEVRSADHLDQVTVYRPSIIVGDSQTAYTTSYHGFYTPLRLAHALVHSVPWETILQGDWLGGLQLEGHERKNLVPVDWVSAVMTWLIVHPEFHGDTYHLTNPLPVTVADMLAAIALALGELAQREQPRPAASAASEELVASFRDQMTIYQSYWSDDPEFDSTNTQRAVPHLPCPRISDEVMERLIRFAIRTNFGWPREPSAAARFDIGRQLHRWLWAAQERPAANGDLGYVSLQVSGQGGGQWHLMVKHGRLVAAGVGLRNGSGPICYLNSQTFSDLTRGKLTWERAVHSGRLIVVGNSRQACDLSRIFCSLKADE